MRTASAIAFGAALLFGVAGCGNYLSGPGLGGDDPNSVAGLKDPGPLYDGVEVAQMANYNTQLGRFIAEYMQQVAGTARQQIGFDLYLVGPGATNGVYDGFWAAPGPGAGGGGAADLRKIQAIALSQHDSIYVGIAKVWEAMLIGDAASIWGAVVYSQAFNSTQYPQPKYDPQMTALTEVEATLDSALVYLHCDTLGVTNLGPTGVLPHGVSRTAEIIYAGRTPGGLAAVYTHVAHTLKARYWMHMASVDASNYAKALTEAQQGITSAADDWNWFAGGNQVNRWVDFMGARGDIAPGAALIHLMKARIANGLDIDNGRFGFYFLDGSSPTPKACALSGNALMPDSGCTGNRPGGNTVLPFGEGFSTFNLWSNDGSFEQPAVTYTETQLIIAEAALKTGNAALAQTSLTNVRNHETYGADVGDNLPNCSAACTFAAQPPVPATLQNIVEEEYIDLMGNLEVYNTYKRTCLPWLAAAPTSPTSSVTRAAIAYRLPYSQNVINADPNTPNVGSSAQNANQPNACPALTYTSTPAAW